MSKTDPIMIEKIHKNFTKYIFIYDNSVTIVYDKLPIKYWKLIIKIAIILSKTGIGPKIYNIDHDELSISMEKIFMFSFKNMRDNIIGERKNQIDEKINQLHGQKLLHNDLHIDNIGYRILDNKNYWEPVFIDYDTITPFNDKHSLPILIRNDKIRYQIPFRKYNHM